MSIIKGHNLFGRHAIGRIEAGMAGGSKGRGFISIEELDDKVDEIVGEPPWMADFQAMKKRREG